jgi:hypothetical protein
MARRNETLPMVKLVLEIDNCSGCPFVNSERTLNAGFAIDYYCAHKEFKDYTENDKYRQSTAVGRKVMSYVEWSSDHQPIPDWCPIRLDGEEAKAKTKQKIVDMIGGADI